ncbi:MAG: ATPase, partial [Alphaproteobacteria bacterium]
MTRDLQPASGIGDITLGRVEAVSGGGARIRLDGRGVDLLVGNDDSALAMAGEIGSMLAMAVASRSVIATVHALDHDAQGVFAHIAFLGEGDRDAAGRLTAFRRGVTRFPFPGTVVTGVS